MQGKFQPSNYSYSRWQLRYASVLGGNGNLKVDLNYMFRMPLYGVHKKLSHNIGTSKTKEIPLFDLHELGAEKLSAGKILENSPCAKEGELKKKPENFVFWVNSIKWTQSRGMKKLYG